MIKAVIGSRNKAKINGARKALALLGINYDDIVSIDVNTPFPQPIGFNEILLGAMIRAWRAYQYINDGYGVGIEAGVIRLGDYMLSGQVAVVVDGEHYSLGTSGFFPLPENISDQILKRMELKNIMRRITSVKEISETIGAIGYLSNGFITRGDLSFEAVLNAILPWINKDLNYGLKPIEYLWETLKKANINP